MNRIITVNLGGNAYPMDDAGYDALRAYLNEAERRLANNPDKAEILADIELAIGDKLRGLLGPNKTVVDARDVAAVLAEMGAVEDETRAEAGDAGASAGTKDEAAGATPRGEPPPPRGAARRLYRIPEGAIIKGVCNGFAAYFAVDVAYVRVAAVLLLLPAALFGWAAPWLLSIAFAAYWVLALSLPTATTPDELAAARGDPSTARDFIRRAREGYYQAMKGLGADERHAWKRRFRREMRTWRREFRHQARVGARGPWPVHRPPFGPAFAMPVLGLLEAAAVILTVVVVFQVITGAAVFGHPLPADVPVWIAVIAVVFAFQVVIWPVRILRHSVWAPMAGATYGVRPVPGFFDTLVWLAAMGAAVWLADRYVPGVHEFIVALPPRLHELGETVKTWWSQPAPPLEKPEAPASITNLAKLLWPSA